MSRDLGSRGTPLPSGGGGGLLHSDGPGARWGGERVDDASASENALGVRSGSGAGCEVRRTVMADGCFGVRVCVRTHI